MALSSELVSQFAKITKDSGTKSDTTVFGTVVEYNGSNYVRLDGSDRLTPASTTVEAKPGERVSILLKNHTATITGNITSPAVRTETVNVQYNEIGTKITAVEADIKTLKTDSIAAEEIAAKYATIESLNATNATVENLKTTKLDTTVATATYATITNLDATNARVTALETNTLTADSATITNLEANKADVEDLTAAEARIDDLESTRATVTALNAGLARVDDLEANSVTSEYLTSNYITANDIQSTYVTATQVASEYAKTTTLESDYAKIDLANVETASIGSVLAKAGLISSATITDGHVTGYLDSVEVNANSITAGTLSVDRLIISGTNKSIIYALNNAGDLTSTVSDTINGDVITKRTIAADHIVAGAITANELHTDSVTSDKILAGAVTAAKISVASLESIVAKIGSFSIANALYSNNHSTYNTAVDGVYIGSDYISLGNGGKTWLKADGSVSIGSGGITYNATSGALNIVASSIKMGSDSIATVSDVSTAKSEAISTASTNASSAIATATADMATTDDVATAKSEAISTAASDATTKANTAKSAAISTAASDATTKANAAKEAAITSVNETLEDYATLTVTDNKISSAVTSSEATLKTYADGKASTAETNAKSYTDQKADSITTTVSSTYATKTALATTDTKASNADTYVSNAKNNYGYQYKYVLTINGESDMYYPVVLRGGNQNVSREIMVTRSYSDQCPEDWNGHSTTHGISLLLKIKCNFGGWGGASYSWAIHDLEEVYGNVFASAGHCMANMGFYIRLRGGGTTGAKYTFYSDQALEVTQMNKSSPMVCYDSDLIGWSGGTEDNPTYSWNAPAPTTRTDALISEIAKKKYITLTQSLDTRVTSAESTITQLSDQISTNVTEITDLGTRMSTVEQTSSSLTVRLDTAEDDIDTAQSTADAAKANAATAQSTADTAKTNAATAQSTADTAKTNAATAQSTATAAAKTATNYLSYDTTNGLLIGNKSSGSWSGLRAQITSSAFNILDSSGTQMASYGSTTTIGKTSGNNIYIDSDSIDIRKNGTVLATFDQYGLKIANTNDATGSLGSGTTKPALVIGTATGYHIEMDNNEIMAKSDATTSSHLFLNMEGGNVSINNNADRALMFQDGALYAKNASYNSGEYLGIIDAINDNGNSTFGYGGYENKIGASNIYGNELNLYSNGNVNVEASWINCRSITPNANATYALGTYGSKGWSNIYLGAGDSKTNALHIIVGTSTYALCGRNSSGQYFFGNNAAIMYYQVKDVNETTTGNAFKMTSGNNTASNNTTSVWAFGGADSTSRYIGSYLAYNRTYSSAANMVVTANGLFGRSTSSSERYKDNIELASIDDLKCLYDLPVKKFKYKSDYIAADDELYGKSLYGFIVEDMEDILPCAVEHITDDEGNSLPEMWNSNIIVPSLLKLIQDLNSRLKVLEEKGV